MNHLDANSEVMIAIMDLWALLPPPLVLSNESYYM